MILKRTGESFENCVQIKSNFKTSKCWTRSLRYASSCCCHWNV